MPKPIVNNKIVYKNIYGRVIKHENFLDQGVQKGDSPTFASLRLTGDAYVEGNLYVQGNSTILDSNIIEFEDNIILLNRLETGNGVTLNQAGFEIERGTLENYRMVYNESDDSFRIGFISDLQTVATRENSPLLNGIMTWNNSMKRLDSTNTITIDLSLTSTSNSLSTTSGSIVISGGMGLSKNLTLGGQISLVGSNNSNKSVLYTDSTTNSLYISSPQNIHLLPLRNIFVPFDKTLSFGTTDQNISANSITNDININGSGHVFFNLNNGKRISVPNMVPITFSTVNEKIYTDGSNNMVITGRQDVNLVPGTNKKVFVPSDTPLAFGNSTQYLSSNLNNDLAIAAANNITLAPGAFLDVKIPTDNNLRFGSSGAQKIYASTANDLHISSSNDINLSPSTSGHVNIPNNVPLSFGTYSEYIKSTQGSLVLSTTNSVKIQTTTNSQNGSSGSIYTLGGLGVTKDTCLSGKLHVSTNASSAVLVMNSAQNVVLNIDTLENAVSIQSTSPSAFSISGMLVADASNKKFNITSSLQAFDTSSGALTVSGGVGINKKLFVGDQAIFQNGIDLSNTKISNLQNPSLAQDAATKAYVDLVKQGLYVKDSVKVATVTHGNLSTDFVTGATVDNYTLQTGDRILIKDQVSPIQNGIYVVQTVGAPSRVDDMQNASNASGTFVFIQMGNRNASLGFICNSEPGSDTVGTHNLNFTQFTGLGHVDAGSGLSKDFNQINVNVDNSSLEIVSDLLRIKHTAAGTGLTGGSGSPLQTTSDQSHVTKLGTINSGTWQASQISVSYGGTGQTHFTQGTLLFGNGTSALNTNSKLFFDNANERLGIGTNTPTYSLSVYHATRASLQLDAAVRSEVILSQSNVPKAGFVYSTNGYEYASDVYADALLVNNFNTSGNSIIQFATNQVARFTLLNNGNVGVATSNPSYTLDVNGTLAAKDTVYLLSTCNASGLSTGSFVASGGASVKKDFFIGGNLYVLDTTSSTSSSTGAVVVNGGLSIACSQNNTGTIGGALSIAGGAFIAKDLNIGGGLTLYSTNVSTSASNGALITNGGVTIHCSSNASETAGGALHVEGGACFQKDVFVNGQMNVSGAFRYNGNGLFDTITNTSGSTSQWFYFGEISSYCEITLSNGTQSDNHDIYNLKFTASIAGTNASFAHQHSGNIMYDDNHVNCFVYHNGSTFYMFARTPPDSHTFIHVAGQSAFDIVSEGFGNSPNGTSSGFSGGWTESYTTIQPSNMATSVGDLIVEGTSCKISDNLPVIGYNNTNTNSSRDIGTLYQRYQISNDTGVGDIVNDTYTFADTIPNQSTVTSLQIKLSNSASSTNNYYNGWWIKVSTGTNINQVRKIVSYNGAQRTAQLDSQWTTQNPIIGDTVRLYNFAYVAAYFDETSNRFKIGFSHVDPETSSLVNNGDCDLQIKNLYVSDTTSSVNVSTGSILTLGGVAVYNTNDSSHSTQGGALSVFGGASIRKRLYVGDNIALGNNVFSPQDSLHIYQSNATLRLENTTGGYSYVNFVENGSNTRFGILNDSKSLSFTWSTSGSSPLTANKAILISSGGNVCINTSNPSTLLTLRSSDFISIDSNNGYLGLVSGTSSTNGGNIVMYGNQSTSPSAGSVQLAATTRGNITLITNNIKRLDIDTNGIVSIYNTSASLNKTTGAVVVTGGISCGTTQNATSASNGGCLTVTGGAGIGKDLYLAGDLYISGNIIGPASVVTSPSITFSNTQGCFVTSYGYNKLISLSNEGILTFYVEVTPSSSSQNCQFEFDVPNRTTTFTQRGELIASCSGYTDDTNITPLFNVLCVGSKSTTRGLVKFQSVSTSIHYLLIMCRYSIS